jgi:ABC-2 type transport system permease protein
MWTQQDRSFLYIKWLQTSRRWKRLNLDSILQSSGFFLLVGFFWLLCYKVVSSLCNQIYYKYDVIGPIVLDRIVSFGFFAALMVITVGHILTAYTSLFSGSGLPQLVGSPFPMRRLYRIQCMEALFLGGWVSGVFCIPIIFAYGWELKATWWYYPVMLVGLVGFLITAGMIGIIIMLMIARWIIGRPIRTAIGSVLVLGGFFSIILYTSIVNRDLLGNIEIHKLGEKLANLRLSAYPYLPSHWISQLMQAAHKGDVYNAFLYLGLLGSSAFFLWHLAMEFGHRSYNQAWLWTREKAHLFSRSRDAKLFRKKRIWFPKLLPRQSGAVVYKERRIFARDFSQWGQMVLILTLVLFYMAHTKNFTFNEQNFQVKKMLAFFNVILLGFIQATLSLRYSFPSISLEGKSFWVVASSAIGLKRFFFAKYYLHTSILLVIGLGMGSLLNNILGVDPTLNAVSLLVLFLFSFGFTSWSMGFGAVFYKFEATGAADVSSDTGALVTMIVTLLYFAISVYLFSRLAFTQTQGTDFIGQLAINPSLILLCALFLFIQTCAILIPPVYGLKKLKNAVL